MELDQIPCKFPKIGNCGYASTIVSQKEKKMNDKEGEDERRINPSKSGGAGSGLYGWPSSRIVRVSRATGGKDRHSKVLTSRGLRDRRVRLSVNTAIEFFDLQDRLGYDQPSKAVEWLLAAAAGSIAELPPMPNSRSEKAVEEKEKEKSCYVSSFTELLSGGGGKDGSQSDENSTLFLKFPMDYFSAEVKPHFSFATDQSAIIRGTLQSNSSQFFGHRHLDADQDT